jgi:hypothetical protein
MRDQSLTDHLGGHGFGLSSGFNKVNTTFETRFLKVTQATTAAKNLRLDNHTALDSASYFHSLVRTESDVS